MFLIYIKIKIHETFYSKIERIVVYFNSFGFFMNELNH